MNHHFILILLSLLFYGIGIFRSPALYAGLGCQVLALVLRGIRLERLPLVGPHDTLFFLSASVMLYAVTVSLRMSDRRRFLVCSVILSAGFSLLSLLYRPHDLPLTPVLRTFWFESHVALSFFSYALFGIAAIAGILFLVRPHDEMEVLQYKTVLVGYSFFSIAMIFGGIWAYYAWGTYWLWTPKELWTVILWLFYSLYLHARLRPWWAGKRSAVLAIAGFGIVMFTYLGVSLFMKSSHAF